MQVPQVAQAVLLVEQVLIIQPQVIRAVQAVAKDIIVPAAQAGIFALRVHIVIQIAAALAQAAHVVNITIQRVILAALIAVRDTTAQVAPQEPLAAQIHIAAATIVVLVRHVRQLATDATLKQEHVPLVNPGII